jgi:hypothetical protein
MTDCRWQDHKSSMKYTNIDEWINEWMHGWMNEKKKKRKKETMSMIRQ